MDGSVSVVVAAFSGADALSSCLASLEAQRDGAEVLVVASADEATARVLERFDWARLVGAGPGSSVFQLRARGLASVRGSVVALLEDHCTVAPGWLQALVTACRQGHPVVGGGVENGLSSRADRALYLVEYGALLPPLVDGPAPILSGVNIAYAREALERCRPVWLHGFYENEVHDALAGSIPGLRGVSGATVTSHLRLTLSVACVHLFVGGLRYGRHRRRQLSRGRAALRFLLAPAIPVVLLVRLLRTIAARRSALLPGAIAALPRSVCLLSAWAAGEAVGLAFREATP